MSRTTEKTLKDLYKNLSFLKILNEMEMVEWKKDLLKTLWNMKQSKLEKKWTDQNISDVIREFTQENRDKILEEMNENNKEE